MKNKAANQQIFFRLLIIFNFLLYTSANAANVGDITTGRNNSNLYEIQINGSGLSDAKVFSLSNPARIVVDIPNAKSTLAQKMVNISHPDINNIIVIEGEDRVRATINMNRVLPYQLYEQPQRITLALGQGQGDQSQQAQRVKPITKNKPVPVRRQETQNAGKAKLGFSRGSDGQGKITINLPNANAAVDVIRNGKVVVARLSGTEFDRSRRLNVLDFGTPVKAIDVYRNRLSISTIDDNVELISYQNERNFSIELSKPTVAKRSQQQFLPGDSDKEYTGEPLSLNFQDIEVRAVLQLIGDFTNSNIVVSDAVTGSITLRMNDVPWDQVLDIILQTKGLSMQKNGSVIYVAPSKDIADSKRAAYDVANVEKELAPLQQQLIQVQYAKAEELEKIIEDNSSALSNNQEVASVDGLLSSRGRVSTDSRTNTIIINDVPSSIDKVRRLVSQLDIAVDQVLIDARVVTTTNNFVHELGVRWGGAFTGATNNVAFGGAGNANGSNNIVNSANNNIATTGQAFPTNIPSLGDRLGVNLGASNPFGSLGLSILGHDFLLDLELSAMESEGRGEVVSSPRVIAQDGGEAKIEQGQQIRLQRVKEVDGVQTVSEEFKEVPLRLIVRPKIAPNQQIDMELDIEKSVVADLASGTLNTSKATTQVLVESGETVVIGGVYEQSKNKAEEKVPVLGDLPIVGRAFRRDTNNVLKSELIIFVTPKIINKRYSSSDKFRALRN